VPPRFEEFEGFVALVEMVRRLYRRPARRVPRHHTPPIAACVQPRLGEDPGLLASIAERLSSTNPRRHVPHVLVDDLPRDTGPTQPPDHALHPITTDDVTAVKDVLLKVADGLARDPGGYRFPRFWLVIWLMAQTFDPGATTVTRLRELRTRLRARAVQPVAAPDEAVLSTLPAWVRVAGYLLPPLFFRARQSGRVPGFGRRYRWFLRQPNLAPGLYRSFFGLAERLTDGQWQREEVPEQVLQLMVNAFLEDLRESFRGTGLRRRYRTTYPIVLLDGITRVNGGYALVRTVSAIRNGTGLFDPLMLITSSRLVPPLADDPQPAGEAPGHGAADSEVALRLWESTLARRRRKRDVVAWLIIVRIPEKARDAPLHKVRNELALLAPVERPSRHPARTRTAAITMVAAVVLGAAAGYGAFGVLHSARTCGDGFTWLGIEETASDVERIEDVCVGVTDGSNPLVLPDGAVFDEVRTTILDQNRRTLEVSAQQPARPLVTLVFMGSLTAPAASGEDALTAEREQLAGMAVAQAVQLDKPHEPYEPLVRVLIANAGPGMRHGEVVARRLGTMAAADPSIVGVIGLSESLETTATTIRALAAAGLPVVSATLSADSLVDVSRLYFGIAPQNRREAEVAASYAADLIATGQQPAGRPIARSARVYFSDDPADIYSRNLAEDMEASFGGRGFAVETISLTPGNGGTGATAADRTVPDPGLAGRDACDFDGVVLYAGRGLPTFHAFLNGIGDRCRDRPPYVLAGDDVTRYVANRHVSGANRSVPFQYLSFAIAPELGGEVPTEAKDFYSRLEGQFPYERTGRGRTLDGHAALNYDAAYTAILAVSYLARDRIAINGGTLWPALMSITDAGDAQRRYRGVTGQIDFGGTVARRVPVDKPVTVVTFTGGAPNAAANLHCAGRDDPLTRPWCPFDA
jgi:hypothetical protein